MTQHPTLVAVRPLPDPAPIAHTTIPGLPTHGSLAMYCGGVAAAPMSPATAGLASVLGLTTTPVFPTATTAPRASAAPARHDASLATPAAAKAADTSGTGVALAEAPTAAAVAQDSAVAAAQLQAAGSAAAVSSTTPQASTPAEGGTDLSSKRPPAHSATTQAPTAAPATSGGAPAQTVGQAAPDAVPALSVAPAVADVEPAQTIPSAAVGGVPVQAVASAAAGGVPALRVVSGAGGVAAGRVESAVLVGRPALAIVAGVGAVDIEVPGLPEVRVWAMKLVQAVAEVLAGDRPISQLVRWTDAAVFTDLNRRVRVLGLTTTATVRGAKERCSIRSVRVCNPASDVAEIAAHVRYGERSRAMALRLEVRRGRWVCTALEVG